MRPQDVLQLSYAEVASLLLLLKELRRAQVKAGVADQLEIWIEYFESVVGQRGGEK